MEPQDPGPAAGAHDAAEDARRAAALESDGLVQLTFKDEEGRLRTLEASELAAVLMGLVDLTDQMSEAGLFGEGPGPQVRIRPVERGSVVVEAVLQLVHTYGEPASQVMGIGGGLALATKVAIKTLRGAEVRDSTPIGDGLVKLNWQDDTVDEVPAVAWEALKKRRRKTKRALAQILKPLGHDAARVEIRGGTAAQATRDVQEQEPVATADRTDYRTAVKERDVDGQPDFTFDTEAQLRSIDFRPGKTKWHISTPEGNRQAIVEDEVFLRSLDRGGAVHKNDLFDVKIKVTTEVKRGRRSTEWSLIHIVRKRKGGVDDDGQGPSPTPS